MEEQATNKTNKLQLKGGTSHQTMLTCQSVWKSRNCLNLSKGEICTYAQVHASHPRNRHQTESIHSWLYSSYWRSWRLSENAQTWWRTINFRSARCGKGILNFRTSHLWTNQTRQRSIWWWWTTSSNTEETNIAKFTASKVPKRTPSKFLLGSIRWRKFTKTSNLHQCPTGKKCQISRAWCRFGHRKLRKFFRK